jgi:hypothetical protein
VNSPKEITTKGVFMNSDTPDTTAKVENPVKATEQATGGTPEKRLDPVDAKEPVKADPTKHPDIKKV